MSILGRLRSAEAALRRYEREDTGHGHVRPGVAWAMADDLRRAMDGASADTIVGDFRAAVGAYVDCMSHPDRLFEEECAEERDQMEALLGGMPEADR